MRDPIDHWHREHADFQRLLGRLQRELDQLARGERPNYELMVDILDYLSGYCDQVHHPREDVAFERLARRLPYLELPLARLQQEHRVIAHAGNALRSLLTTILDGGMVPRAQVEAAAATYLVYYLSHIAWEERELIGRAAHALDAADWQAVREAVPHGADPLFGPVPEQRYRELRRQIELEAA